MPQRSYNAETGANQVRLTTGLVLKPPVSLEDLRTDTEYDPEGAEEFAGVDPGASPGRLSAATTR